MAGVVAASFVGCLGLTSLVLLILSGALYKDWWGLMILIPYVLIPLPRCICGGGGDGMGGNSAAGVTGESGTADASVRTHHRDLIDGPAHFLEGIIWTCVFGIPSVMVHTEVVSPRCFRLVGVSLCLCTKDCNGPIRVHPELNFPGIHHLLLGLRVRPISMTYCTAGPDTACGRCALMDLS